MVGEDGNARTLRKLFLNITTNTWTSLEYWLNMPFIELIPWLELLAEGAEDSV